MFHVISAGSRSFSNYRLLFDKMDYFLKNIQDQICILSGNARGADQLGERYAQEKGYKLLLFPANWQLYGKRAGYIRNLQMVKQANALVAFWDGQSKGTKHAID